MIPSLLVKGRAGMGNRILSVLSGIVYARLTGRRLIVDWSDHTYSADGSDVFHRFFECSLCSPGDRIPATDSVNPPIWRGNLTESVATLEKRLPDLNRDDFQRTSTVDLSRTDHLEDLLVFWTYAPQVDRLRRHFRGRFAHLRRESQNAILANMLETDLTLHPDIERRVDEFWAEHLDGRTIGVHVRYSDRRARLEVILKTLDALVTRQRGARVFLATDNVEVEQLFEQRYPAVISAPRLYPAPGLSVHYNVSADDRFRSGTEALIDLYLLGRCPYLIVDTRSSLSRVAALLAAKKASRVVDVRPLARLSPRTRGLLTPFLDRVGFRKLASDGVVRRARP